MDKETVEIVRCAHCKFDGTNECPIVIGEGLAGMFMNHDPDFFCAYGEPIFATEDEKETFMQSMRRYNSFIEAHGH